MRNEERLSRRTILGMLVASAAAGSLVFRSMMERNRKRNSETTITGAVSRKTAEPDAKTLRAAFYDAEVEPKVFETDQVNREAADRVVVRLRDTFRQYHAGVDAFVSDLTSLSTRLGVVKRMPAQWWAGDNRIDDFVREKFEKHLFSEQKLLADIGSVVTSFQQDIDANQRRMLTEIRASLTASDLPQVSMSTYEEFYNHVAKKLQSYSTTQGANLGSETVFNALTVLIVSEAGSYVATSLIAGLLARFGTAAAVSTVAASGAAAGSATVGAGGGTLGGPVGVVVGFGVGLAVGLIIDWWMTDKFETETSLRMNAYLASLQHAILYGDSTASDDSTRAGLVSALPVVCDRLLDAYRERFYAQIVTGVS
jgi:hypothetical protein